MTKVEERHNEELVKVLNTENLPELQKKYNDLLQNATLEDSEELEVVYAKMEKASITTIKALEALNEKIDKNYQRKLRYHHVGSTNYKIGAMKTNELGDFLKNNNLNPEVTWMNKEKQTEQQTKLSFALNSLKPIDFIIYTTYKELGFYPTHENWKKLSETLFIKGIKKSDKSCKLHFEKSFKLLQSLVK